MRGRRAQGVSHPAAGQERGRGAEAIPVRAAARELVGVGRPVWGRPPGDAAFRIRRAVTGPYFAPQVGETYRAGASGRPRYPCVPPAFTCYA